MDKSPSFSSMLLPAPKKQRGRLGGRTGTKQNPVDVSAERSYVRSVAFSWEPELREEVTCDKPLQIPEVPLVNWTREALANEDVLHLIFEHFDLQPGSKTIAQTRKDLLSAAKTCKAFSEPAQNLLWRVLPSLLPLLLLLPSAEVTNGQYFIDNLPSDKWERFAIHARRVRTLYMEAHRVVISPITYDRIRRSMRDSPILPGLKAIYIPDNNSIDFFPIMLLTVGASLEVVELNGTAISERNFFVPFMTSLASNSSHLRQLAVRGPGIISLEPVYRLTSLQRLEIKLSGTYLYPQTVQKLGNLVNLLELIIDVGAEAPVSAINTRLLTSSSSGSDRHPGSLRRLRIIGMSSSITRVMDDLNLTSLTELVIDEMPSNTRDDTQWFWRRCFDQISVCHAIEHIEINQVQQQWSHDHPLSTSWFFALSSLKSIKSLVINGCALSGSDEDFRLLAGIFPKLTKFVVPGSPRHQSQGRTLACLFYFAQGCPDLHEINICFAFDIHKNLDAVRALPRTTIIKHRQHPLEKLDIDSQFGQIQAPHMIEVAEFLDRSFPNLAILETHGSNSTETTNWKGIQQFRVSLQTARINAFNRGRSEMEMESNDRF